MIFRKIEMPIGKTMYMYLPDNTRATHTGTRLSILDFPENDDLASIDQRALFFTQEGYQYFAVPVQPVKKMAEAEKIARYSIDYIGKFGSDQMTDRGLVNIYASGKNSIYALSIGTGNNVRASSMILREPDFSGTDFSTDVFDAHMCPVFYSKKNPTTADLAFGKAMVQYHIISSFHLAGNIPDANAILTWLYRIRLIRGCAMPIWN